MITREQARSIQRRLIWASLPLQLLDDPACGGRPRPLLWMGLGLLSDLGLPFCSMHMFLAAKALRATSGDDSGVTVLLADVHALEQGESAESVRRRAATCAIEVAAIGEVLRCHFDILLASRLAGDPLFVAELERSHAWLHRHDVPPCGASPYTVRAVADMLYFERRAGLKIGWSVDPSLDPARGQHHEPETDLIAAAIDGSVAAVYVRHGVTLDSRRPRAVPYTEIRDAASRLMLSGASAGRFAVKSSDPKVSAKRRHAVLQHVAIVVEAFEALVCELAGDSVIAKAQSLCDLIGDALWRARAVPGAGGIGYAVAGANAREVART